MSTTADDRSVFTWKDFSRFVQVAPVERGWLVLWGHFRDAGRTRELSRGSGHMPISPACGVASRTRYSN